ncbi:MAG: hypothetical protein N2117_05635 [Anaerolineales bacterium]|nr:hypothetical protein [Anaerolineales bacterium]MCX7754713.1 hypothetical protein [Anaerolineales bacterium]MDW8278135.1 hypothetical protein [Anaerolineales bacterium]
MRHRIFFIISGFVLLSLLLVRPVLAFQGRSEENIVIGPEEVIADDLYATAETITVDGTIQGDLLAVGSIITINGTVEGDLIAAAQTVIVNGVIRDDARIAAGAILFSEKAIVGSDIVSAGASLELRPGSDVGQDVIFTGGQALLGGNISRDLKIGVGGIELRGTVGRNASITAGEPEQGDTGPMIFLPDSPIPLPKVAPGLKIDPQAKIEGELEYTSPRDLPVPPGVAERVRRLQPTEEMQNIPRPLTPTERLAEGVLNLLRNLVTLLLIGATLFWLFPQFLQTSAEQVRAAPLPAFGWGIVSWAAFFFAITLIIVAMLVGSIAFGLLTLNRLSAAILWTGALLLFLVIMVFVLASTFVSKIIVALVGGQWILRRLRPEWAEGRFGALALGVTLFAILAALPFVGNLVNILVILLGLGGLWLYGRKWFKKEPPIEAPVGA